MYAFTHLHSISIRGLRVNLEYKDATAELALLILSALHSKDLSFSINLSL